jgi:hypothetical protein
MYKQDGVRIQVNGLKGLSHEMDFTFDDMYMLVLGLHTGRGHFLNFLGAPMIL